jgi:catechol 2,3-dioxygenase-like lactoylglutathione lyase family enzyme
MFVLGNVTFDCADPRRLAEFWSQATGYELKESNDFMATLSHPQGHRPNLLFIKVPEPRTAKNRVHVDFGIDVGNLEAEVQRLEALGATRGETHDEWGFIWTVLQDPEGNEFCIGHPSSSGAQQP